MSSSVSRSITLGDGTVGFAEYGDPSGVPLLYCPGVPGSHVEAEAFDQAAAAAGIRVVAVDRPGMGGSSPAAAQPVVDWPDTAVQLADHLDWDQFAVIGVSGGGPYALACAYRLPGRVSGIAVVSAPAPFDKHPDGDLDAAARKRRRSLAMLQRFPFLTGPAAAQLEKAVRKRGGIDTLISQMAQVDQARVAADPELAAKMAANLAEAFRQGPRGFATDLRSLFGKPWGFDLTDITAPVQIWHGDADLNLPCSESRRLATLLPHTDLHLIPGAGHLLFIDYAAEILDSLCLR